FDLTLFFIHSSTIDLTTLSLHDALPIFGVGRELGIAALLVVDHLIEAALNLGLVRIGGALRRVAGGAGFQRAARFQHVIAVLRIDRKSTRLNSSHVKISYAVFCLKKKIK